VRGHITAAGTALGWSRHEAALVPCAPRYPRGALSAPAMLAGSAERHPAKDGDEAKQKHEGERPHQTVNRREQQGRQHRCPTCLLGGKQRADNGPAGPLCLGFTTVVPLIPPGGTERLVPDGVVMARSA
jgi:hypothetical protein